MTSALALGQVVDSSEQKTPKLDKAVFKDTLDGKLDVSRFLIEMHGFIPVLQIITEPALGSFGLMLAPVFITPNKNQVEGEYTPPDITAGFAGYTANNSWLAGALRSASLPRLKMKYRAGGGYTDINMDFYRELPQLGERSFAFNFKAVTFFGSLSREIANSDLFVGLSYLYARNSVSPEFDFNETPEIIEGLELDHNLSRVGADLEFDKRDNVFTPNSGIYLLADLKVNANWTGSDFDYQTLRLTAYKYFQFSPKWVSGFRVETKFQFGDAPFYVQPGIDLRGVPAARYQGESSYVFETEQRYDIKPRWSILAFGGLAKAPNEQQSFGDSELVYNYGTGFRYLLARLFNLRVGIDVAFSNDDFGYYFVFGSAWRGN